MADVFGGKSLSFEHMTQVAAALCTENFDSVAICVGFPSDGAFNLIIERRPAAMSVEFVLRAIQWCIAPFTDIVPAGLKMVGILAGIWDFSAFVQQDVLFFRR